MIDRFKSVIVENGIPARTVAAYIDLNPVRAGMLMRRVRYFSDGAVIGSRECVEICFQKGRERFGPKRKSGARRMRGTAVQAAEVIWTARDLQKKITA